MYQSNITKLFIIRFLLGLDFFAAVLIPFFLHWGGLTFPQTMLLQSIFVFTIFFFEVPTGTIADTYGRKTSLILACLVFLIAIPLYSLTPNYFLFMLAEFFWGISFTLFSGADQALIYDSLKQLNQEHTSKKVLGRFASMELIALTIGTPLGGFIGATYGLPATFHFMVPLVVIAGIMACTLKEPPLETKQEKRYFQTMIQGFTHFRNHAALKILAFDAISIWTLSFFIVWTYQLVLLDFTFPIHLFGFVTAALTGAQALVLFNVSKLEALVGKKRYLTLSAIIPGIAFLLLGLTNALAVAILMMTLIAAFGMSRRSLLESYIHKHASSTTRATVLSTVSMLGSLASGILLPILGILVEWSLRGALIGIGMAILVVALISRTEEEHLLD